MTQRFIELKKFPLHGSDIGLLEIDLCYLSYGRY